MLKYSHRYDYRIEPDFIIEPTSDTLDRVRGISVRRDLHIEGTTQYVVREAIRNGYKHISFRGKFNIKNYIRLYNVENVTFIGYGSKFVIPDGVVVGSIFTAEFCKNLNFIGFEFDLNKKGTNRDPDHTKQGAFYLHGSDFCLIRDCKIYNGHWRAISLYGTRGCIVENNYVVNMGSEFINIDHGIINKKTSENIVINNTIIATEQSDLNTKGIEVDGHPDYESSESNIIAFNRIYGNYYLNIGINIVNAKALYNRVIGNYVEKCIKGITVLDAKGTIVSNNIIRLCKREGIESNVNSIKSIIESNILISNSQESNETYWSIYGRGQGDIIAFNQFIDETTIKQRGIATYSGNKAIVIGNNVDNMNYKIGLYSDSERRLAICNNGYVSRNRGVVTIPAGQTGITFAHGLASTPSLIVLTPTKQVNVRVVTYGSSNISIEQSNVLQENHDVMWYAEI